MADDSQLLDEVRGWIDRGGLVFEMEVARRFAEVAPFVIQSERYLDPVTHQSREIDVNAYFLASPDEAGRHGIEAVIECKATTAPWVLYVGRDWANGPWPPVAHGDEQCAVCERLEAKLDDLRVGLPTAYAITEKRTGNGPDRAYEAVQQVSNAILARFGDGPGWSGHSEDGYTTSLFGLPLVVTRSPLVTCTLGESGAVELEVVQLAEVIVKRLDLPVDGFEGVSVIVVNADALDEFVKAVSICLHIPASAQPGAHDLR